MFLYFSCLDPMLIPSFRYKKACKNRMRIALLHTFLTTVSHFDPKPPMRIPWFFFFAMRIREVLLLAA